MQSCHCSSKYFDSFTSQSNNCDTDFKNSCRFKGDFHLLVINWIKKKVPTCTLCNKSVRSVVSPWVRVFVGVNEAFGRNSQYPCTAHSRLWVVSVMSCNEPPGVWMYADTTSQPRPEGASCGGNINAPADKTTSRVSVCERMRGRECVCVCVCVCESISWGY